jgi:hypothetical protein
VYRVLVGKPEGNIPLGKSRHRREVGIRMNVRENGWGSVKWVHLAQDRSRWRALVNIVINMQLLTPRS